MNRTHEIPRHLLKRDPVYFSSADYVLGILKHAIASHSNTQIDLSGNGSVTVLPAKGAYHAAVNDMEAFCRADTSAFRIAAQKKDAKPDAAAGPARPIRELLWHAAFHAAQGRLVESHSNGEPVRIFDVITFRRWPNLTRLPTTRNTMRICALLTRQPTSIMLAPRKLGIEQEEVFQVYSAACSSGLVHVVGDHQGDADINDLGARPDPRIDDGLLHSLFTKIMGL